MLDKTVLEMTTAPPKVGYHLISSVVDDLTPDYVKQFRSLPATTTERELKEGRVEHLDQKAENGQLVTFHWVTAQLDGETRRVNGQHSSTMLERRIVKEKFPKDLKVHREHFEVDDGNGLALLFRQFDDRASGRSPLDISGVYQGLHPELLDINRKIAKLGIDGYVWYQRQVEKVPMPIGDDAYGLFSDTGLYPLLHWINGLFAVKSEEMKHQPVVAAIVGTYMTNEAAAKDFWQEVVNLPNGDDDPSPQSVLTNWLLAMQAKKIDRPEKAHVYQGCIYAWNAFRDNKSITAIRDDIKKNFFAIHE